MSDQPKAKLILNLYCSQFDNSIRNLIQLLDVLIAELRLDNDTADIDGVRRNQGEIKAYNTLREFILYGLPSPSLSPSPSP